VELSITLNLSLIWVTIRLAEGYNSWGMWHAQEISLTYIKNWFEHLTERGQCYRWDIKRELNEIVWKHVNYLNLCIC